MLIALLCGCNISLQKEIIFHIEKTCNENEPCIVRIQEITDFEWDNMYVFKVGVSLETINHVIGFEYPYFTDVAYRVIFTKSNAVVYHEDTFPYPERRLDRQVFFEIPSDTMKYLSLSKDEAIFVSERILDNNDKYYVLTLFVP